MPTKKDFDLFVLMFFFGNAAFALFRVWARKAVGETSPGGLKDTVGQAVQIGLGR